MKQELTASKVFSSMAVFDMFSGQLNRAMIAITQATAGKVSLDRVTDFLQNVRIFFSNTSLADNPLASQTDLLDEFEAAKDETSETRLGLGQGVFSWSSGTPSNEEFVLRIEEDLVFPTNTVSVLVGPTGCGKTSLLMAMLGKWLLRSTLIWYYH